jgi:hypothetical protein
VQTAEFSPIDRLVDSLGRKMSGGLIWEESLKLVADLFGAASAQQYLLHGLAQFSVVADPASSGPGTSGRGAFLCSERSVGPLRG